MSDSIILALIVFLILCLIVTVVAAVVYSGLFTEVNIKTGSPYIKNVTIAYKLHKGPYKDCGAAFTETVSIGPKLNTIRVSYDDSTEVRHLNCMLTCENNQTVFTFRCISQLFSKEQSLNQESRMEFWFGSMNKVSCPMPRCTADDFPPSVVPVYFGISMQLTKTWQPDRMGKSSQESDEKTEFMPLC